MDDKQIVQLFWSRNEQAIPATALKYGNYCTAIATNILTDRQDVEECINDTYLNAWNSMPPHKPNILSTFLGKITRNLAINRYRQNHAAKRGGSEFPLVLDELAECVSGTDNVEQTVEGRELTETIDAFLTTLPASKRNLFICRYWYFDSISSIASRFGITENNVSVTLNRLRLKLRHYLSERGFEL